MYKLALVLSLVFVGCSDDGKETNNLSNNVRDLGERDSNSGKNDVGTDDTASDLTENDLQNDGSTNDCTPLLDTTFNIQDKAQVGQLYARASWSGSTGWVIYAAPATQGDPEAIFLTRVSCEGTVITPPIQISPVGSPDRHLHPVLVSRGGNTFVSWYSQTIGGGQTSIWFQSYSEDGTPITSAPLDITPKNDLGVPLSNLIWEPAIAATSGDEVVVGYSYGSADGFKIGIQHLDKTGLLGTFITPVEDTIDQKAPSFGVDDEGNIALSWIREDGTDRVSYLGTIPLGATRSVPAAGVPSKPLTTPNALARVTKHASDSGLMFQAFQVTTAQRSDILVRNASDLSSAKSLTFGLSQNNYRPSIASGNTGGVVAWYRYTQSPIRGKVVLQAFNDELEGGAEVTFDMTFDGIPPFGPDVVHVQDDIYLITWSEGQSGREAEVKARFVRLSAP